MSQNYLGTIDTEDGEVKILRKAKGRDLYNGLNQHGQSRLTAYLISMVCQKNDKRLKMSEVEDFDIGLVTTIEQAVTDKVEMIPKQTESYPQVYELVYADNPDVKKKVEIINKLTLRLRTKALEMCGNKAEVAGFYMASEVIKIDEQKIRFDDFLDFVRKPTAHLLDGRLLHRLILRSY